MKWNDAFLTIVIGAILLVAVYLMLGCATKCERNSCCPKPGHGPCPICEVIYDRDDIIYGR